MIKSKQSDKRITKIYAIVLVTAIVLMSVASYMVFNKPATAQVSGGSAVSLSLSEKALDKILSALGLGVTPEPEMAVGAVSGPFMPFDHIQWGLGQGIRIYPTATALKTGTTTICAIQSPVATSTLLRGGVVFTVSSSTATTITIAKATTAFATTTVLESEAISAGEQETILWNQTDADTADMIFVPSQWFVVGMQGGLGLGEYTPEGVCHATFESYSI